MSRALLKSLSICALPLAVVAAAGPAASAQAPATTPTRTVVSVGTASAAVTPQDRNSNASIQKAVEDAQAAALPDAVREGRDYAAKLAAAAGLTLGELVSISNAPSAPYGPFAYSLGPFGPGRYCGNRRQPIVKRDAQGRRKVVGHRTRRLCVVPPRVTQQVTLTFAVS